MKKNQLELIVLGVLVLILIGAAWFAFSPKG
jgi:cbb3-type cytochrome oxidase subunit 3